MKPKDLGALRLNLQTMAQQLENERSTWIPHWQDLADHISPRRYRYVQEERNQGPKKNHKIIDNTAGLAARTLSAGIMSGLTSPSRPWFKLLSQNPSNRASAGVRRWLEDIEIGMREVFAKSNLYTALPICYSDLGIFGTHASLILEDDDDTIRIHPLPIGSYSLATDAKGRVDTIVRRFSMTARQLVQEFGEENVSSTALNAYKNNEKQRGNNGEQWFKVTHVVWPNPRPSKSKIDDPMDRPYHSAYYEDGVNQYDDRNLQEKFLRLSGFHEFPGICPRWSVTGEDVYGYGPGFDALPDVRSLQVLAKRKAQATEKMINPPLVGPSSLINQRISLLPGDISYSDAPSGMGLRALHEVRFDIGAAIEEIRETQGRVRSAMYQDLFLMLQQIDRKDITATEIQAREQERMLQLGPVMERLNDELLDPLIDRTFGIMYRKGMIPEPPKEIQGTKIKVEYSSIMSQAQKLLGITSVDRMMGFVGNLSAVSPEVMDNINTDEVTSAYADMLGVSPKMVRSKEEVLKIRQARAQQAAQQQAVENSAIQAKNAEILSKTDIQRPSALTAIAQQMAG